MTARTKDTSRDVEAGLRQGYGEIAGLVAGNAEAMVAANRALLDGAETVAGLAFAFTRERLEKGLALQRGLAGCNSPQQAAELQAEFARETLQSMTDNGRQISESMLKAAGACWQPLQARTVAVVDKVDTSLAA